MSERRPHLAIAFLFLATIAWGLSFPLTKAASLAEQALLPGRSSWFYSAHSLVVRMGIAALVLAAWRPRMLAHITPHEWKQGIGLGFFIAGGALLQNDGLLYTDASTSAFLTTFYCVILPIVAALEQRAWPHWLVGVSTLLVLVGVGALSGVDLRNLRLGRGEISTLAGSFFFAADILYLERPEFRGNNVAVFLLPVTLFNAHSPHDLWLAAASVPVLTMLAALIVFCTLAAFITMNVWQPHIEATHAGLIYCAEPVFTALLCLFLPGLLSAWAGIAYPNETLSAHLLIGGGLITVANVLILLRPKAAP
jgi:drug/metabolite transporter (DMT)-like permease